MHYEYRVLCDDPTHMRGDPPLGDLKACLLYLAGTEDFSCRPRIQRREVLTPPPWEDFDWRAER